ncbi:hypothetical protein BDV93DRAFT_528113 [Ceratobasidium sp. AG-I]|nr:hypothetical protein BDV93DRAFT_528113 [Ceratobasidium sp. AG-I]
MISGRDVLLQSPESLTATRSTTSLPAPINHLPLEILSYIFLISKNYCDHEKTSPYRDGFSEVSVYWRRIAINTPALWTHIDISVGGYRSYRYESTRLYLERSCELAVHIHVYESEDDYDNSTSDTEIHQLTALLAPCLPRVGTLELESDSLSKRLIESILDFWMDNGVPGSTSVLSVCRPINAKPIGPTQESTSAYQAKSPERFEDVLLHLRALRLQNTAFRWDSAAYRNLIELEFDASTVQPLSIPISTLATILASSPNLVTLKLANLTINMSDDWDVSSVVRLEALQVLNIVDLKPQSLRSILPSIALPKHSSSLSVGMTFSSGYELYETIHNFCARSCITTLYLTPNNNWDNVERLLPALFSWMPNLERLALDQYAFEERILPESTSESLNPIDSEEALSPPLSELFLLHCRVSMAALISLVQLGRVQVLHLQCCTNFATSSYQEVKTIGSARKSLHRMFPDLECIVSQTDATTQWPCRTIFRYTL